MVSLKFVPDFFPVVLLPLYWVFWLAFYVFYLPFYFLLWLFSPWRSKKSLLSYYSRKASKDKRTVSYSSETAEKAVSGASDGSKADSPSAGSDEPKKDDLD